MPTDGSIPKGASFACRHCKEWFASSTGRINHPKRYPGHQLYSLLTGMDCHSRKYKKDMPALIPTPTLQTNGHGEIPQALLEYAFEKMRSEIERQLDHLQDVWILGAKPIEKGTRKTYVAR
jgi:hypothetical protein